MIKLDDFLSKKKEPAQVLDLSKVKITSKEEFRKYFDKIPECKVKPEKITPESIKIKDKDFAFVPKKRERKQVREWNYLDPTPPDMKGAKLEDLCPVNIDWKMLTTLRPKTKVEEDMFSRLVQLGKLDLKYQQALKREKVTDWIKKTKNPKSSILEMKVVSCRECGEDFCDSSMCSKLMYDNFYRPQATTTGPSPNLLLPPGGEETRKKKKKKKKKRKRKTRKGSPNKAKRKKLGKNSIFNRPASRGCNRDHSRSATKVMEKRQPRAFSLTRSSSPERTRRSLYEGRSKSAPRIHFECDFLGSKSTRYEYSSDSCPTQTDYSSQSDSENPDFGQKFNVSRLRLSGRRKLLSARVGFSERSQRKSSGESSRSRFVRKCTLYKDYHSDASIPETQNDDDDTSSTSSTSTPSRSPSKSPKRNLPKSSTSASQPSTIQIQFDDLFSPPGFRFPEKIFLSNRNSSSPQRRKLHRRVVTGQEITKVTEGFSKIALEFDDDSLKKSGLVLQRPKTGNCLYGPTHRISRLSKFSGPYLKARGLFESKS